MKRYEYKIITDNTDTPEKMLNVLGNVGWELVSYDFTGKYVFKLELITW